MLKFGLSQLNGNFEIADIPLTDSVFILQIAHVAYQGHMVKFVRKHSDAVVNFGNLVLSKKENLLNEVSIDAPPVLLRNDTLEINPYAFKTLANAVVEDLLTQVPGIVVWGDGSITVNGKKVTKVMVEGKPFFGGDPTIATRNLPKDAIEKIKVYEEKTQLDEDPQLSMDIILKSGSKSGFFGKAGGGLGNQKRYEAIGSLNRFTPKTQVSLFGGANNTNKESFSVSDFLRVNTYKAGVDAMDTYGTNFNKTGDNDFLLGGGRVQQQWSDSLRSDVDALLYSLDADVNRQVRETVSINAIKRQMDTEESERRSENRLQVDQHTLIDNSKYDFGIRASFDHRTTDRSVETDIQTREDDVLLSSLDNQNQEKNTEDNSSINLEYKLKDMLYANDKLNLNYTFISSIREGSLLQDIARLNTDNEESALSRAINSTYKKNYHALSGSFDVLSLAGKVSNWRLRVLNTITLGRLQDQQTDFLQNKQTREYDILNQSFSYSDQLREEHWKPGLSLFRNYTKRLGRGTNRFNFELKIEEDIFWRVNSSDNAQRLLDKRFHSFLPSLRLNYTLNRSDYERRLSFGYKKLVQRPERYQQNSLPDTVYRLYNYIGNRALLPEDQHELAVQLSNTNSRGFVQEINLRYLSRQHQIADSTIFGATGERTVYPVNVAGRPRFSIDYLARGSQLVFEKPLTIFLTARINAEKNNYFVNAERRMSRNVNSGLTTNLSYVPSSVVSVQFIGGYNIYHSGDDFYTYNLQNYGFGGSVQLSLPKRITLINSVNSIRNKMSGQRLVKQNLWNLHAYHRFSKKEQFEVKLSMYDLLRQRKNINYSVFNNLERSQINNNLQQFFVIGFSYFPRVF